MSNMPKPCKRPGDMVMIVPCPEHEVDLMANTGFIVMDMMQRSPWNFCVLKKKVNFTPQDPTEAARIILITAALAIL